MALGVLYSILANREIDVSIEAGKWESGATVERMTD